LQSLDIPDILIAAELHAFPMSEVNPRGRWPDFRALRTVSPAMLAHPWRACRNAPPLVFTLPPLPLPIDPMEVESLHGDKKDKGKGKAVEDDTTAEAETSAQAERPCGRSETIEFFRHPLKSGGHSKSHSKGQSKACSQSHSREGIGKYKSVEIIPTDSHFSHPIFVSS
jgi:hypothetical protein